MWKRCLTTTFTKKIDELTKHNILFVDTIEFTIHNPDTVSKMSSNREYIYKATIKYRDNNILKYKELEDDNFNNIYTQVNNFIHNEVKP